MILGNKMKRTTEIGWRLFAAMLTGLLSVTLVAEELENKVKFQVIDEIVAPKNSLNVSRFRFN